MIEAMPFKAEHFRMLEIQPRQAEEVTDEVLKAVEEFSYARTYMENGKPIAIAGLFQETPWRAKAWAYLSPGMEKTMVPVFGGFRREILATSYRRVEMDVDTDFEQGHRMARLLGFTRECDRPHHGNGKTTTLYSLVR